MNNTSPHYDIVLIGAGIMSATLGALLHELNPDATIWIFERLDTVAQESSRAMNNAGTWHSAFCELNYTPQKADGSIDIAKAVAIAEAFEISKEFRAYLVEHKYITQPHTFINPIPHCSLVFGEKDIAFLHARYKAMQASPLFHGMEFSQDPSVITTWMPLIMQGRDPSIPVAATHMAIGTDVDFWSLTHQIITHLTQSDKVSLHLGHHIRNLSQDNNGTRTIVAHDKNTDSNKTITTPFVFIGAWGWALPLLQKSHIVEWKWFGGFPVSGQRLICNNPSIIEQHAAKVYGKAALWAPPMSVPHLDTRIIDGKKALLFGPYAGFTTKFLQKWSFLDLPLSIHYNNIRSMLWAGAHNLPLTKYLIDQVRQSMNDRLDALREYVIDARPEDWDLKEAGYRVQIIKADKKQGGTLQFGTEVIVSADHTLATLLGASPWASTAVDIMVNIIEQCFPQYCESSDDQTSPAIQKLIPTYGKHLRDNVEALEEMRKWTGKVLQID